MGNAGVPCPAGLASYDGEAGGFYFADRNSDLGLSGAWPQGCPIARDVTGCLDFDDRWFLCGDLVLGKKRVKHRIGDRISHLVRMTFSDGFRGKETLSHGPPSISC